MTGEMPRTGKTERAMWIAIAEFSLLIIGFVALLPTAIIMAFVIFVYVLISSSFTGSGLRELTYCRKMRKERINDDEELTIEETIKNEGKRPVFLEVMSELPPELVVSEGSNHYLTYLKGKQAHRIRYKIRSNFLGHFTIRGVSMRTMDLFFASFQEDRKEVENIISVYPVFEELRKFPSSRINVKPLQGSMPSRSPGPGTEFFEIRDYVPGDEFRRINWKASARVGNLLSNEYEWERMADVYIVLDSTRSSKHFSTDYIKMCASIGDYFLRLGNRVGLIAIGKFWTWVRSGSGRKQLIRLVDNLIDERPDEPISFGFQADNTLRVVPQASTVILLSTMRDHRIRELTESLVERRQRMLAVIPTTDANYLKMSQRDPSSVTATKKLVRLERENASMFLKRIGVNAIEWDPRLPLAMTMEAVGRWLGRTPVPMG
nr:DUF58 domain-containing protein [Candidatus Njordarchaeota archaeon]